MTPQAFYAAWRAGETAVASGLPLAFVREAAGRAAREYVRRVQRRNPSLTPRKRAVLCVDYAEVFTEAAFGLVEGWARLAGDEEQLAMVHAYYWRKTA